MSSHAHSAADQPFWSFLSGIVPRKKIRPTDGVWTYCEITRRALPAHGWKLHVSSTPHHAVQTLRLAAGVCVQQRINFKFLKDAAALYASNGKGWARGYSGKFMTIYPRNLAEFRRVGDLLSAELRDIRGPYILSDRRYPDSTVVYYRYGGFLPQTRLNPDGTLESVLIGPGREIVPDGRTPFFSVPPWADDPFPEPADELEDDGEGTLKDGRYKIEAPIYFSNSGGVYRAWDSESASTVVVKEARPHTFPDPNGLDAVALLRNEHRILQTIEDLDIAPRPIDLFTDWEHTFLVESYVPGSRMTPLISRIHPALMSNPKESDIRSFVSKIVRMARQLARCVDLLHERGIVFGDLSPGNFLVHGKALKLRLIDFEGAYQLGSTAAPAIMTRGFSPEDRGTRPPERADDIYALGALVLYMLWPVDVRSSDSVLGRKEMLRAVRRDLGVESALFELAARACSERVATESERRQLTAADFVRAASKRPKFSEPGRDLEITNEELRDVAVGTRQHLIESLEAFASSPTATLWPALDERAGPSGELSVMYGWAGVAHALHAVGAEVPRFAIDRLLNSEVSPTQLTIGLHNGAGGIASVLAALGFQERALDIMFAFTKHPLRGRCHDLANGTAGWGLSNLLVWRETGDDSLLSEAVDAARELVASASASEDTLCWSGGGDSAPVGYLHGSSGVAQFLAAVASVTGATDLAEASRQALRFDLSAAIRDEVEIAGFPAESPPRPGSANYPYLGRGSAGVLFATLEVLAFRPEDSSLRDVVPDLATSAAKRFSVSPTLYTGLAGCAYALLDAYAATGVPLYEESALRAAATVLMHKRPRATGYAFANEMNGVDVASYSSGAAGILLLLHRLAFGGGNCNFSTSAFLRSDLGPRA